MYIHTKYGTLYRAGEDTEDMGDRNLTKSTGDGKYPTSYKTSPERGTQIVTTTVKKKHGKCPAVTRQVRKGDKRNRTITTGKKAHGTLTQRVTRQVWRGVFAEMEMTLTGHRHKTRKSRGLGQGDTAVAHTQTARAHRGTCAERHETTVPRGIVWYTHTQYR